MGEGGMGLDGRRREEKEGEKTKDAEKIEWRVGSGRE